MKINQADGVWGSSTSFVPRPVSMALRNFVLNLWQRFSGCAIRRLSVGTHVPHAEGEH